MTRLRPLPATAAHARCMLRRVLRATLVAGALAAAASAHADDEAARYVQFVEDDVAKCVARNAMQIQVRSTHPSRRIKVWLDRTLGGSGTGDRSRSELLPGAAPEPLGCSRDQGLVQAWKIVRAEFLD